MYLLDPYALYDLICREAEGHTAIRKYLHRNPEGRLGTCVPAIAVLWEGLEQGVASPEVRARVERFLNQMEILPVDPEVAKAWARLRTDQPSHSLEGPTWVAAVALRHSWPILTRDPASYRGIPYVRVIRYGEAAERAEE